MKRFYLASKTDAYTVSMTHQDLPLLSKHEGIEDDNDQGLFFYTGIILDVVP